VIVSVASFHRHLHAAGPDHPRPAEATQVVLHPIRRRTTQ
jgi:hypothetical protein